MTWLTSVWRACPTAFTQRLACGFVVAVASLAGAASPAAAHTDLLQASPGVSQRVGGEVEHLDFVFSEPISDLAVSVEGPVGPVAGRVTVDQGSVVSYQLDEPLAEPGRYTVGYTMTSFDLDFTEREFFFDYEEAAPQPFRIAADGSFVLEPPGRNWLSLFSTLLLAVSVIGIALLLIYRQGFFRSSAGAKAVEISPADGDFEEHQEASDSAESVDSDVEAGAQTSADNESSAD